MCEICWKCTLFHFGIYTLVLGYLTGLQESLHIFSSLSSALCPKKPFIILAYPDSCLHLLNLRDPGLTWHCPLHLKCLQRLWPIIRRISFGFPFSRGSPSWNTWCRVWNLLLHVNFVQIFCCFCREDKCGSSYSNLIKKPSIFSFCSDDYESIEST